MLYGFSGLGQEPAQPGWAQMAECLAQGGTWTGAECVPSPVSAVERACVAAGGIFNPKTGQCSIGVVTPGQPPPQQPPKKGLSPLGWAAVAVVGAVAATWYLRRK